MAWVALCVTVDVFWHFLIFLYLRMALVTYRGKCKSVCVCVCRYVCVSTCRYTCAEALHLLLLCKRGGLFFYIAVGRRFGGILTGEMLFFVIVCQLVL